MDQYALIWCAIRPNWARKAQIKFGLVQLDLFLTNGLKWAEIADPFLPFLI